MATTRLMPLHTGKGKTVAAALGRTIGYVKNPDKTNNGELVTTYECDPLSIDSEFLFAKREYAKQTGREQGKRDVIAYHLRQSFKPGEIDPADANRLGYELAMKLTKGQHAFIVATHVDRKHIHSHIIFNSISLDYDRKFRNFWNSSFVIRRISDQICLENGLSVIDNPKPSRGHYGLWLGDAKPPSNRDKLRELIDTALPACKDSDGFIATMKSAGCEVKRGKNLAFKIPGGERFIRCNALGVDYTDDAIVERISGKRNVAPKQKADSRPAVQKPNLLIDIEAKIQQGYGLGFERFAKTHNLKEAAKTLMFLQDCGLTEYDALAEKVDAVSKAFKETTHRIKRIESRLNEISTLQKNIGAYSKTREVYKQYRDSGWSKKLYAKNESDIIIHRTAKKNFDSLGLTKLPSMKSLKQEYATLDAKKRKLYQGYRSKREEMIALQRAKSNVDRLLEEPRQAAKTYERDVL